MGLTIVDVPLQSASKKPCLVEGDTIPEIEIDIVSSLDLTTSTIKLQLYNYMGTKVFDWSNASGITVVNATKMIIDEISAANNTLSEGQYIGDLEITDASGFKTTYFRLRYNILKQYTK